MSISAKQIILDNPPTGKVEYDLSSPESTFKVVTKELSESQLGPKQVLVKTLYLSNDPTQRGWIQKDQDPAKAYVPPVLKGDIVKSLGVGKVIAAGSESKYEAGDFVSGFMGWTEYGIIEETAIFTKIDTTKKLPLFYYLTIFGMTSLTAWIGLHEIAEIKETDTVLVSAASGATGSIVVQLAKKIFNCKKVVGISSSEEKCKYVESIGADVCLNYNDEDFAKKLAAASGETGYSVYWDNVGGATLDLALLNLALKGRVVACGAIAAYNDSSLSQINNWFCVITKRLTVKGFIVGDHAAKYGEAINTLTTGLMSGKISVKEGVDFTVVDCQGDKFDQVPKTWGKLFSSKPNGKLVTLVSEN
ncbi:hypothetical protein CANARDRAFT_51815 [[Candida] arabinofermentans NRRL YB-2248]|uniref:Enoyl reductase (ER) domain-containing protein n=1 Tax=[Candida] arabinofermentans NRRL YB-2248 TaxID=983967 RepID=A0A1E4T7P3_9ASCO|nr:hypothetical protein CANARDRAFT_51815 [[Candida] arabinofermentans NRRL YB-2248]